MTQKQIGEYIKGCIQSQGWTLTQVASKSKITRPTLDSIINGKNYRMHNFIKVCEVLKIDFGKLIITEQTTKTNEDDED